MRMALKEVALVLLVICSSSIYGLNAGSTKTTTLKSVNTTEEARSSGVTDNSFADANLGAARETQLTMKIADVPTISVSYGNGPSSSYKPSSSSDASWKSNLGESCSGEPRTVSECFANTRRLLGGACV